MLILCRQLSFLFYLSVIKGAADKDTRRKIKQKVKNDDEYELSRYRPMLKTVVEVSRTGCSLGQHSKTNDFCKGPCSWQARRDGLSVCERRAVRLPRVLRACGHCAGHLFA
jgi:hypothetical protein